MGLGGGWCFRLFALWFGFLLGTACPHVAFVLLDFFPFFNKDSFSHKKEFIIRSI